MTDKVLSTAIPNAVSGTADGGCRRDLLSCLRCQTAARFFVKCRTVLTPGWCSQLSWWLCLLRLSRIDASLGHDEAYTAEAFSSQPVSRLITSYAEPNNHIFHSLLVRLVVNRLGKENWMVRVPALLAGLATVPVIYLLGRALFVEPAVGALAAWLLAVLPIHISHSQAARGYSLLLLTTALSTLFLVRAMQNNRLGDWTGFSLSGFLAAWTLPSGVFHLLSLLVWAGIAGNGKLRRSLLLAGGSALALIALAYLPLRDELAEASARWGIDAWADPLAIPRIMSQVFLQFVGGWTGLVPAAGVVAGIALVVRSRDEARLYLGLAWGVPFLAALITGAGAQPRAYFYLVTGLVLAAALGAVRLVPPTRWRLAAGVVLIAGHAWTATSLLPSDQTVDPYAELAAFLQSYEGAGEQVVTPFIMDVRVWAQARDPLAQRLAQVLVSGRLERLLFVTGKTDPRFKLESYLLKTPVGAIPLALPVDRFSSAFESGSLQLQTLRSRGERLFVQTAVDWKLGENHGDGAYLEAGPPALGAQPSLRVVNKTDEQVQVYSATPFSTPGEGMLVLVGARTTRESYLSLYQQHPDGSLERPHLFRTAVGPAPVRGNDGGIWYLEALLLPSQPEVRYGVYMLCPEAKELAFADVACYFLPFAPP